MPLSRTDASRLEDYQFQMGRDAGNLALTLDQLTDAMQLVAAHVVYCRVEKGPRAGQAPLDVAELMRRLQTAKGLIQESLLRLRAAPD